MSAEPCEGLLIGLKPKSTRVEAGGRLEYELAIGNAGAAPKRLVLFNDTEGAFRTRVRIESRGKEPVFAALVVPALRTQGGQKISVTIPPGKAHLSEGWFTLPPGLKGNLTLVPIFGGTTAMACEVRGKPVSISAG
jgi:hypothetical protein